MAVGWYTYLEEGDDRWKSRLPGTYVVEIDSYTTLVRSIEDDRL